MFPVAGNRTVREEDARQLRHGAWSQPGSAVDCPANELSIKKERPIKQEGQGEQFCCNDQSKTEPFGPGRRWSPCKRVSRLSRTAGMVAIRCCSAGRFSARLHMLAYPVYVFERLAGPPCWNSSEISSTLSFEAMTVSVRWIAA